MPREYLYYKLTTPEEMEAIGFATKIACPKGARLFLTGQLGSGKTVFCRGYLRGAGYKGRVKSPTFTIVESYAMLGFDVHHFDFYRIEDSTELDFIGLDQYFDDVSDVLVEWPSKGEGVLPSADLLIEVAVGAEPHLRELKMYGETERGCVIISNLRHQSFGGLHSDSSQSMG